MSVLLLQTEQTMLSGIPGWQAVVWGISAVRNQMVHSQPQCTLYHDPVPGVDMPSFHRRWLGTDTCGTAEPSGTT